MSILSQASLGELVAADERRAVFFDRLGLDYCCSGDRTLGEACQAKGLDPATVSAALEALDAADPRAESTTDWTGRPLAELIEHIVDTHHAYLRRELPRLAMLFERVTSVHGHQSPWLREAQDVYSRLRLKLSAHTRSEETVVFPLIRALEAGEQPAEARDAEALLAGAEAEHEEAGNALGRLRALSDDYTPPEWACERFRSLLDGLATLEADTHRHVHKENSILFPRARRLAADRTVARS